MADDPKIVPDPPPAAPRDVRVTPDPPPASPVDVPTFPDPPPGGPFPVTTVPDPGPRVPTDVPVAPDPGPWVPVDVTVAVDPSPWAPIDVPVTPDPPPVTPFDPGTAPDPAPWVPVDVGIVPDPAPWDPVDPSTIPSDPGVPPLPDPILPAGSTSTPTVQQIIAAVSRFDRALGTFLDGIVEVEASSVTGPGGGALDPVALAKWFKDYLSVVGNAGLTKFVAEQSTLYAMNPVVARVFDPTYFLKMLVPGTMGILSTTVDVEAGLTLERVAQAQDQVTQAQVQSSPLRPGGRPDVYGPENTMEDGQDFSVDEMVDAAADGSPHPYLSTDTDGVKRFDASKYFQDRDSYGAVLARATVKTRAANGVENLRGREAALVASNFLDGVIRVPISRTEDPDGAVYSQTPDPSSLVHDDEARLPLCFTDLRRDPVRRAYRSVYFRPLNLNFAASIAPDFRDDGAFGRVDPTVTYVKTTRTFNIGFEVHVFAPEDLRVMHNKLTWLTSMCYPTYTSDSLIKSGPVCRLRIGDAVSTSAGGLPGVIRSLDFDFGDALWELKQNYRVPRSVKVQLSFLALHEGPVGLVNGSFGVFRLPVDGNAPDKNTNLAGSPTDSRDNGPPTGVSQVPGGFSRFGEPVKKG